MNRSGGGGSSLNMRWAQMAQQKEVIEERKRLYLAKQNVAKTTPEITPVNAFSNDGSFLDKFKRMSEEAAAKKAQPPQAQLVQSPPSRRDNERRDRDRYDARAATMRQRSRSPPRCKPIMMEREPRFDIPPPSFIPPSLVHFPPPQFTVPPPLPFFHSVPEPRPLDASSIPPPKPMDVRTIRPPSPIRLGNIPKPKELDLRSIPPPPNRDVDDAPAVPETSADPSTRRAYSEQPKSRSAVPDAYRFAEYGGFSYGSDRGPVLNSNPEYQRAPPVDDSEKYEPEFSLRDDSSSDESHEPPHSQSNNPKPKHYTDNSSDSDDEVKKERIKKKKSRWGDTASLAGKIGPPGVLPINPTCSTSNLNLTKITRHDPELIKYAMKTYGSVLLTEEDWKKCEDHYKINMLYQQMLAKRNEIERLKAAGRHKYEYDSDEEIDENGTWEHRLRQQEMEATQNWANELTRQANGKHHIGDFLPPDELKKFMDKYSLVKSGKEPDLSDYKEFKLKEDNIGFKMLQKLGWTEGEGLGLDKSGIVEPVNKSSVPNTSQGLGTEKVDSLGEGDDEFDAYRKRMMLAYRFRPNPLNNPRRPYY